MNVTLSEIGEAMPKIKVNRTSLEDWRVIESIKIGGETLMKIKKNFNLYLQEKLLPIKWNYFGNKIKIKYKINKMKLKTY